jgi:hypothetical protein
MSKTKAASYYRQPSWYMYSGKLRAVQMPREAGKELENNLDRGFEYIMRRRPVVHIGDVLKASRL